METIKDVSCGSGLSLSSDIKIEPNSKKVCAFYNAIAKDSSKSGLDVRNQSRIYYLRNLNNWVKSTIIAKYLDIITRNKSGRQINVLDFCCGKGGDQIKWQRGRVDHVTFVDISSASIDACKERYDSLKSRNKHNHMYTADFIVHDCTTVLTFNRKYDLVNCQFSLHYAFETFTQATNMLQNISSALNDGGYFISTLPNAFELMKRRQLALKERSKEEEKELVSFGNSVYKITFDASTNEKLPLFGASYHFQLEGVVDCPEFLVYPPLLIAMAKERGLRCLNNGLLTFDNHFHNITSDREESESYRLLSTMDALESWTHLNLDDFHSDEHKSRDRSGSERRRDRSRSPVASSRQKPLVAAAEKGAYRHVEKLVKQHSRMANQTIGTISQSEWDTFSIYCIFAFQKMEQM